MCKRFITAGQGLLSCRSMGLSLRWSASLWASAWRLTRRWETMSNWGMVRVPPWPLLFRWDGELRESSLSRSNPGMLLRSEVASMNC